ncbi:uncharacterized protein LOC109854003 [Pseudomyrmex gracilis]|uniref:uncharacterized protein LOC109854003 n=1 Tax=Pseudomyrmex gracilis TaxID=219809 RepID=UPI0009954F83|nr:uncharacterized protein LOC109854003 [Pseudomyrmex gracilis]
MDLVYVPEVFTYGYSRNPQYRDYEQPWNKNYFGATGGKVAEKQRSSEKLSKEKCHLCKEMKRRNLAVYIRNKRSNSYNEEIEEEEEHDATKHDEKNGRETADQGKSAKSKTDKMQKS